VASHDDERGLPHVWPFTFAGLLILVALAWFCAGFAIEDLGDELPGLYEVFFVLLGAAAVLIVGGATVNLRNEHRRRKGTDS